MSVGGWRDWSSEGVGEDVDEPPRREISIIMIERLQPTCHDGNGRLLDEIVRSGTQEDTREVLVNITARVLERTLEVYPTLENQRLP